MKLSRHSLSLAICAVAVFGLAAQAFGAFSIPAFFLAHPDLALGLSTLAFIGETAIISPEEIKAALSKISDQVKEVGEKAIAESKSALGMSAKTKETVDELMTKQGNIMTQVTSIEQRFDALVKAGLNGNKSALTTAGREVVESEGFQNYVKAGDFRKGFAMPVKAVVSITSDLASAGDLVEPQRLQGIIAAPDRRMTVRDLITPGTTGSNLIQYVKETGFQNMAATVAEGAAKPKSDITFELVSTPVVKIATYVKASMEILQDASMLRSYIDGRLRYMLSYIEEGQLLKGSGSGNNLNGIYTQATAFAAPIVIASPTRIDILRLALLQAELAEYPATGIVLHPSDWAAIELTKDTTGAYIFANPQSMLQPALWGRPVVGTQAMTVDTFLVGAFKLGAQVFDRMQSQVLVATENEDDFIKNMITILAEERLGLAVYRPEAFIKGDITPA